MDDHNQPGQHWVAFYIDEHGTGTYFDTNSVLGFHIPLTFLTELYHASLEHYAPARYALSNLRTILLCIFIFHV